MFIPTRYEFKEAIRLGGTGGLLSIDASKVDIHEDDRWIVFVQDDGRATRVPRENINYISGTWAVHVATPTQSPEVPAAPAAAARKKSK